MEVSFAAVNEIVKTLPVGYYIGREVKVSLSKDDPTSYYDVIGDKIYISMNNIQMALSKVEETSKEEIEKTVRTLLYHELSHAILTPKSLKNSIAMNIVEDERIEDLMKGYFINTDFEENCRRINSDSSKENVNTAFFDLVRFRKGPQGFLEELDKILWKFRGLTRNSDSYLSNRYFERVESLYKAFCNWYSRDDKDQITNDQIKKDIQDRGDHFNYPANEKSESESRSFKDEGSFRDDESERSCDSKDSKDSEGSGEGGNKSRSSAKVPRQISSIVNQYNNPRLTADFERIFSQSNKIKKANSSAINAYSGVFDPRSVVRNDYKYFLQKNRSGSAKAYSKVHLNLFLDRSGSFSDNVQVANEILYSLATIERRYPDFDFTLISCGIGETIESDKHRECEAYDGTEISCKIFETFKKVQKRDCINYNVVLYDGLAYYRVREFTDGAATNFGAFNTPNTLIITDPSNKDALQYCPEARTVVSSNYTEELKSNLIKMLEILTK